MINACAELARNDGLHFDVLYFRACDIVFLRLNIGPAIGEISVADRAAATR